MKPLPCNMCPYCKKPIYDAVSTHTDNCKAFKKHLANFRVTDIKETHDETNSKQYKHVSFHQ